MFHELVLAFVSSSWLYLFLDFSLSGDGLHGFAHRLFVPEKLHGLYRFQVFVQIVDDGDPGGQVQLHDGSI